jgi:hypothetical protein
MLECLILGDSIAYGISQIRTECVAYVKSGINSHAWNLRWGQRIEPSDIVIISLGSNDLSGINTEVELSNLRNKISANKVFWILPAIKLQIQDIVEYIAYENQDTVLKIEHLSKDKVHPTYQGYVELSQKSKP